MNIIKMEIVIKNNKIKNNIKKRINKYYKYKSKFKYKI